jgi:2-deoxy-D-gluconate 3-dehydrogenase
MLSIYTQCTLSALLVNKGTMPNVLELFSFDGRTTLITGASRGIGQALAVALAEAGSDIVLIQRPGSKDTTTKDEVEKLGRKATIFYADLAETNDLKGLVQKITYAGHDIDILVNCGGIQRRHPAHQFPDDDWNEVSKVS